MDTTVDVTMPSWRPTTQSAATAVLWIDRLPRFGAG